MRTSSTAFDSRRSQRHTASAIDDRRSERIIRSEEDGRLQALGPYRVVGILGKGGMGMVYEVEDTRLGRLVALKVVNQAEDAAEEDIARFHREASAVARLKHPNIVPIHDVGRVGNLHYFTMDCINGATLDEWITLQEPPVKDRVAMVATVAEALQHAHEHGIIHRDLKPTNILIDRQGTPYLTDFGLARDNMHESRLTVSGLAVGTPEYMSPEQASGQSASIGPAADVWGLGAMLYEICTRHVPFPGEHTYAILDSIVRREPVSPHRHNPAIDPGLERIILTCLEKPIHSRYRSAAALAADLRAWMDGGTIQARAPGLDLLVRRLVGRHPLLFGSLAATITLVAGLLVGMQQIDQVIEERVERLSEGGYQLLNQAAAQPDGQKVSLLIEAEARFRLGLEDLPGHDGCTKGVRTAAILLGQAAMRDGQWQRAQGKISLARDHGLPLGDYLQFLEDLQRARDGALARPNTRAQLLIDDAGLGDERRIPFDRARLELVSLERDPTVTVLLQALESGNAAQCHLALAVLEWTGRSEHGPAIVRRLRSRQEPLEASERASAIRTLAHLAPQHPTVRRWLQEIATDPDSAVLIDKLLPSLLPRPPSVDEDGPDGSSLETDTASGDDPAD